MHLLCSLVFFCLSFNVGNWSGDPIMNQFLSGLVEMVGCILIIPVISHFGRRNSHMFCLAGAAVAMFLDEALRDSLKDNKGRSHI